jgi:hypothetical protein
LASVNDCQRKASVLYFGTLILARRLRIQSPAFADILRAKIGLFPHRAGKPGSETLKDGVVDLAMPFLAFQLKLR